MFGYPAAGFHRAAFAIFALPFALLAFGCGGDQPRENQDESYYTDQSRAVLAPDPAPGDAAGGQAGMQAGMDGPARADAGGDPGAALSGWSIVLQRVTRGGMDAARRQLASVREQAGIEGAFVDQRDEGLVIAYGKYLGRSDPDAQHDLKRFREMEIDGERPFASAIITPPTGDDLRGSNPAYDLRTVKQRFGRDAVYTLQVGVYGRGDYQNPSEEDLRQFRRAAEEAVRDLRAAGEMAFYYHAPARSMVTVGVFSERDFDSTTLPPFQSPQLKAVRERFPHNLLNGQGINETLRMESGRTTQLQSSQLVAIPEE